MTEHSAVIFVFFFLAEYASIVLICILTSIFFFGGYLLFFPINVPFMVELLYFFNIISYDMYFFYIYNPFDLNIFIENILSSLMLAFKSCIMIFNFIWVRASLPRMRFDQLMTICWTIILPIIIGFIICIPCFLYSLNILSTNFYLL